MKKLIQIIIFYFVVTLVVTNASVTQAAGNLLEDNTSFHIEPLPLIAEVGCPHIIKVSVKRNPGFDNSITITMPDLADLGVLSSLPVTLGKNDTSASFTLEADSNAKLDFYKNVILLAEVTLSASQREVLKTTKRIQKLEVPVDLLVRWKGSYFDLQVDPPQMDVKRGTTVEGATLRVDRDGCEKRKVEVSVVGDLPEKVSITPSSFTFQPLVNEHSFQIKTDISSPLGDHPVSFEGKGVVLATPLLVDSVTVPLKLKLCDPDFGLSLSTSTLEISQDGSDTVELTVVPFCGMSAYPVSVRVENLPPGVTATLPMQPIPPFNKPIKMIFETDPQAPLGPPRDIRIIGKSMINGSLVEREKLLSIKVEPLCFSFTLSPDPLYVKTGSNAPVNAVLKRCKGFRGHLRVAIKLHNESGETITTPTGITISPQSLYLKEGDVPKEIKVSVDQATNLEKFKLRANIWSSDDRSFFAESTVNVICGEHRSLGIIYPEYNTIDTCFSYESPFALPIGLYWYGFLPQSLQEVKVFLNDVEMETMLRPWIGTDLQVSGFVFGTCGSLYPAPLKFFSFDFLFDILPLKLRVEAPICNEVMKRTVVLKKKIYGPGEVVPPRTGWPTSDEGTKCPSGQRQCDGVCVDLKNDSFNCGSCNYRCPPGKYCNHGYCGDCPRGGHLCFQTRYEPEAFCCDGICCRNWNTNPTWEVYNCCSGGCKGDWYGTCE